MLQISFWWMNYVGYPHPTVLLDPHRVTELYSLERSVISARFKAHVSFLNLQALILLDVEIKLLNVKNFSHCIFKENRLQQCVGLRLEKFPSKCSLLTQILFHMPSGVIGNVCVSQPGIGTGPCWGWRDSSGLLTWTQSCQGPPRPQTQKETAQPPFYPLGWCSKGKAKAFLDVWVWCW